MEHRTQKYSNYFWNIWQEKAAVVLQVGWRLGRWGRWNLWYGQHCASVQSLFINLYKKFIRKKVIVSFLVCMFHSTHRNTKLGHRDVIWVNTETHTLLDVRRKAPGLWWTFTFLLSGAPGKKNKKQRGCYSWMINRHTHMCAHIHTHVVTWSGFIPFPPVGTWEKENVPSLSDRVRCIYHISCLALNWLQWAVNGNPVSRGRGSCI